MLADTLLTILNTLSLDSVPMGPLYHQLSSADPSDRSWSLSAISNLSSTPHLRRLFLSSGIISHLIDRFTDSVENVVVEATGAMRNLLVDAGSEVGGEVVNNGGLVALGGLVPKVSCYSGYHTFIHHL